MKKITKEEAASLPQIDGRSGVVRTALLNLSVGEILHIERQDWKQVNTPKQMVDTLAERTGRKFNFIKLAYGKGWLVERVK